MPHSHEQVTPQINSRTLLCKCEYIPTPIGGRNRYTCSHDSSGGALGDSRAAYSCDRQ